MPVIKLFSNVRPTRPSVGPAKTTATPSAPLKPPVLSSADAGYPEGLLKGLSTAITESIGKPEAYVSAIVRLDTPMTFGGTEEPAAFADIHSIGSIGGAKNKAISAAVSKVVEEKLGVPASRFYIQFNDSAPTDFGFKGSTF